MKNEFTYPDIKKLFGLSTARLTQMVTAGFIYPSIEKVSSGRKNRYSFEDMVRLSILLDLLAMRLPAENIRFIMGNLRFVKENSFFVFSAQDISKSLLDGYTIEERAALGHNMGRFSAYSGENKPEIPEDYNMSIVVNVRRKRKQVEAQIKTLPG